MAGPLTRESIALLADRAAQGSSPEYRDAVSRAVTDTLTVYTTGRLGDWLAYLDAYGVEIPDFALSNPDAEEELWRMTREFFQSALVRVEDVTVAAGYERVPLDDRGWTRADASPGFARRSARRDPARDFLRGLSDDQRTVLRVSVPGTFTGFLGDQFAALWGIEFTLNPRTGRWVLTEMVMMGDRGLPGVPNFLL